MKEGCHLSAGNPYMQVMQFWQRCWACSNDYGSDMFTIQARLDVHSGLELWGVEIVLRSLGMGIGKTSVFSPIFIRFLVFPVGRNSKSNQDFLQAPK
jgi:hypothetical protein